MKKIDIYKALGEGKTLEHEEYGEYAAEDNGNMSFVCPNQWSIKEELEMFCKFKHKSEDCIIFTAPILVGSERYENCKKNGFIEGKHKTFDEF